MKEAELRRLLQFETCVMGSLRVYDTDGHINHNIQTFCTLELPWRDNKPSESCIPIGRYVCRRVCSPKFGDTFEICDVPNRSNILYHYGNFYKDTRGCILLGDSVNIGTESICDSKKAFQRFMDALKGVEEFKLIVR